MKTKDIVVWTVTILSIVWAYTDMIKDILEGKDDDYFTDDD